MPDLLAADLLMRIGVNADGVDTEIASKLTKAERAAVASGDRIAAGVSRGANQASAAQLRVVAATERYNAVLQKSSATVGQRASAQASLISAQKAYNRELDRTERETLAVSRSEGSRLTGLKGIIAAGAAYKAVQFFKNSAVEASDLAESTSKVDVVFGRLAPKIQAFAKTAPQALGQSSQEALEAAGTFGNFFTALGLTQAKSAEMSTSVVKLAADLASFNNENPADVLVALRSGLAGEVEPLRKYGINLADATLKQEALRQGLIDTTSGTLPAAIKAQVAYSLIMQQSTTAQGDFARTSQGVANQQRIAAAETKNLQAAVGNGLIPVERDLLKVANDLLPAVKGIAGTFAALAGNGPIRRSAEVLGIVAAGFYGVNKAVKLYNEVQVNVLRRAPATITANAGVAASYDGIAAAADRAAVAQGRSATAGVAGGAKTGLLSKLGTKGGIVGTSVLATVGLLAADQRAQGNRRDALADEIATPQQLAKARERLAEIDRLAQRDNGRPDLFVERTDLAAAIKEAAPRIKAAAAKAGKDAGSAAGDAFKAGFVASDAAKAFAERSLFSGTERENNIASARDALNTAIQARNEANRSLAEARNTSTGGERASANDIRIAQLRLESARSRLGGENGSTASERASVLSAERTLNDLRNKGKATADQTAAAEGKVADAIRSQKDAQDRVNEARKALDEARGISAQEALRRIQADAKAQGTLKQDLQKLVGKGATQETLSSLKALEDQSPGTIHRIAENSGKKFQNDFAMALARINRRTSAIERLFDGAETLAERRGRKIAAALQKGIAEGLKDFDPVAFFDGPLPTGPGPFLPSTPAPRTLPRKVQNSNYPIP